MPTAVPRALAAAAALALGAVGACHIGQRSENFPLAKSPRGADIEIALDGKQQLTGELLAAEDSAYVIVRDGRILRVPYRAVRGSSLPQHGASERGAPDARMVAFARDRSRYPRGITADLMARLLAAYGQDSIAVRE